MQNDAAKYKDPGGKADLSATLASLSDLIARLTHLVTSEDQRADLQLLQVITARLHRSAIQSAANPVTTGLQHFEPERFHRLLDLAGPRHASELLSRLAEDLADTRAKTAMAAGLRDWPSLRNASHVLISLSGSVGAVSLQHLAERLNATAQAQDDATLAAIIGIALAELDTLIAIVAATKPKPCP